MTYNNGGRCIVLVRPTLCDGPMNFGLSVRSSNFIAAFFSGLGHNIFSYILHEIEGLEVLKTDGTEFNEKIFAWQKKGPKRPKWSDLSVRTLGQHFFSGLPH